MSFNTFCNICFTKENIIKLCGEENGTILNILISFTSCPDIVNGIIYLCIHCSNKLEEYDNFREMCLTNFVRFRYLYNEQKKHLEIRNAPDIEIQLKAFVEVNVERPSGTPLIENYEAAQALRNDTTCDIDINYKQESDGELIKTDLDDLLNQNDLSHAEYISLENDIQIYQEKYGIYSSNEIQKNNAIIALGNGSKIFHFQSKEIFHVNAQALRNDTTCDIDINYKQESDAELTKIDFDDLLNQNDFNHAYISFSSKNEDQEIKGNSVVKNEPNLDRFKESQDQLACDTVAKASPCHESADDEICNAPFNTEDCVTDDRFEESQDQRVSDTVVNASPCYESADDDNSDVLFNPEGCVTDDSTDDEDESNPDPLEESQDQLVCDTVTNASPCHESADDEISNVPFKPEDCVTDDRYEESQDQLVNASPCHESADDDTSDVSFNPEDCVTDDSTDDEGSTNSETKTKTSDTTCNGCDESLPCDKCRHTTFTDTTKIQKRSHSDKRPYECDECGFRFKVNSHLKRHKRVHTAEKPYKCDECGLEFKQQSSLKQHNLKHTGEKPYKCDECDLGFIQLNILKTHKLKHTGERPYQCDECGMRFTRQSHLTAHKRTHSSEKPYKCDKCGLGFKYLSSLKSHKLKHTGVKPFKCDECTLTFTRLFTLKAHKCIHNGGKPYKCDECDMAFLLRSSLTSHKRIHTGEKPYKCDECGVGFRQSTSLKTHKLKHTGEKPYKCDECGVGFTQSFRLKRHKVIHTGEKPYKCNDCGLGFTQSCSLKRHKRTHTGGKSYKCDECGVEFAKRSSFSKHKRVHTDEKPYECDECVLGFTKRSYLNKHKLTHAENRSLSCD